MGQHIGRQCGGIQLLVAAQLRNVCVQKVCVIHGVKQELAPPTGLLQSKAQLLADAAGTDRIFGKKDQIIRLQSLAKAVGQRIQPYKFIAVCRNMMLLEQINALGTTVLVVTHERELVNRFTKRVVAISEGRIISDGLDGYYLNEEE